MHLWETHFEFNLNTNNKKKKLNYYKWKDNNGCLYYIKQIYTHIIFITIFC